MPGEKKKKKSFVFFHGSAGADRRCAKFQSLNSQQRRGHWTLNLG